MDEKEHIEIERKYLIKRPSETVLAALPESDITEITQTYLNPKISNSARRVRKRGTPERGFVYTYTEKIPRAFGECFENEREISAAEYEKLICEAAADAEPIEKKRCVFRFEGQLFELDVYAFSDEFATLEIELEDIGKSVTLPPQLEVIKDVTGDRRYSNSALAKSRRLEIL